MLGAQVISIPHFNACDYQCATNQQSFTEHTIKGS